MKIYLYAENPLIARHIQKVISHLMIKKIDFEVREKNPNSLLGLKISKRGVPIVIFDGSVRSSPERLNILKAIKKYNEPVIVLITGASKPAYCSYNTYIDWNFSDNVYPFNMRIGLSKTQIKMIVKLILEWPDIPKNHLEIWRCLSENK